LTHSAVLGRPADPSGDRTAAARVGCAANGSPPAAPVTVVVLTHDEEANLPACLASVAGWVEEIVVVDSGSRDRTLEIARQHGARILSHPFETHTRQWRWALDTLRDDTGGRLDRWILGLDADQRVSPELRDELRARWQEAAAAPRAGEPHGFYVNRRQIFRGRWIRHGGYYPKYLLKLFRLDRVQLDDRDLVDHHFYVSGPVGTLSGDLIEDNLKENDISFWIEKHCGYAARLAREEFLRRRDNAGTTGTAGAASVDPRSRRMRWRKRCWSRVPLFVRPFLYFFYRYVCRLGFLDGKQGLVFHFLHACWFRFLVDVHLDELQQTRRSGAPSGSRVSETHSPTHNRDAATGPCSIDRLGKER
jgi:glycosyltransferase involved in cell wall biosynthesis